MSLPPVFRLVALIGLGVFVFRYSLAAQACVAAILLLVALGRGRESLSRVLHALRRIRWLLLSLAIVYLVIAPEPELSGAGSLLPAWPDVELAMRRAGVLILLVMAVELMRQTTPAPEIAAAINLLLRPMRRIGADTERFSRRMALTLDAVPRTAEAVAAAAGRAGIRGRNLAGWSEAAAELIREIETGATHTRPSANLPTLSRPTVAQWCSLAVVLGGLLTLAWL